MAISTNYRKRNRPIIIDFDGNAVEGRNREKDEVAVRLQVHVELWEVRLSSAAFESGADNDGSGSDAADDLRVTEATRALFGGKVQVLRKVRVEMRRECSRWRRGNQIGSNF